MVLRQRISVSVVHAIEVSNINTDGATGKRQDASKQGFNVDPLIQKQADCISTMTYNEYWRVIDAGYKPSQLVVFKYARTMTSDTLEDGLYVLGEQARRRGVSQGRMARFVKASMDGWN